MKSEISVGLPETEPLYARERSAESMENIDALPTRIYRAPAAVAGAEEKTADEREKERVTCMVCLMEYGQTMQRMQTRNTLRCERNSTSPRRSVFKKHDFL